MVLALSFRYLWKGARCVSHVLIACFGAYEHELAVFRGLSRLSQGLRAGDEAMRDSFGAAEDVLIIAHEAGAWTW